MARSSAVILVHSDFFEALFCGEKSDLVGI